MSVDPNNYLDTAMEVFTFMVKLPSPLSEFVFKKMVTNSFSVASALPIEQAKKQLIQAVAYSIESSSNVDNLIKFIDLKNLNFTELSNLNKAIGNGDDLCQQLSSLCSMTSLLSPQDLIQSYRSFCVSMTSEEGLRNTRAYILNKLDGVLSSPKNIDSQNTSQKESNSCGLYTDNCFKFLGYQTFFHLWCFYDHTTNEMDECFINWYCKGEILDLVIDAIADGGVFYISRQLMELLSKTSKVNKAFSKVVQDRFDLYAKSYNIFRQGFKFGCEENVEEKKHEQVNSLFVIKGFYTTDEKEYVQGLQKIYEGLIQLQYIKPSEDSSVSSEDGCSFNQFSYIFSANKKVEPIKWYGDRCELAQFLAIANGGQVICKADADVANKIFLNKEGGEGGVSSLRQIQNASEDCRKIILKLFEESGFKRNKYTI